MRIVHAQCLALDMAFYADHVVREATILQDELR